MISRTYERIISNRRIHAGDTRRKVIDSIRGSCDPSIYSSTRCCWVILYGAFLYTIRCTIYRVVSTCFTYLVRFSTRSPIWNIQREDSVRHHWSKIHMWCFRHGFQPILECTKTRMRKTTQACLLSWKKKKKKFLSHVNFGHFLSIPHNHNKFE